MKKRPLAIISLVISLIAPTLFAEAIVHDHSDESLEIAELIVNLSGSITRDLNPPARGAERIVTNATVSDEGTTRTFYIEGKDVYHTGRVLSTYWIRLHKQINSNTIGTADVHNGPRPMEGRALGAEAIALIGPLLNGLYDIAELQLDHRRIALDRVTEISSDNAEDPWTFELVGVNQVCSHTELNTFKISVSRVQTRGRVAYYTELTMPYIPLVPVLPPGSEIIPIPVPGT